MHLNDHPHEGFCRYSQDNPNAYSKVTEPRDTRRPIPLFLKDDGIAHKAEEKNCVDNTYVEVPADTKSGVPNQSLLEGDVCLCPLTRLVQKWPWIEAGSGFAE